MSGSSALQLLLAQGLLPEAADGLDVARVTTLSWQLAHDFAELRAEIQAAWESLLDYWLLLEEEEFLEREANRGVRLSDWEYYGYHEDEFGPAQAWSDAWGRLYE